jgi:predicted GTPase
VVVYGKSGAGKSSLINLIAGRDVAETDPDSFLYTKIPAPFEVTIGEECFRLWDTGGRHSSMTKFGVGVA